MKYLIINFKNAKLFPFDWNGKDFISDLSIRNKRQTQLMYEQPITVHQISNMLHKMMGERPVPSFRYVGYKKQNDIFELARNAYLKIDSIKKYNKNKKRDEFIKETMQVKKSAHNGWNKQPNIFWKKIQIMMGDCFDEFIKKFSEILGYDVLLKPFMSYQLSAKDKSEYNELVEWLQKNNKTPIANFLTKDKFNVSEITINIKIGETTVRGVSNINILFGTIIIPMSNKQLKRIVYNTATILDGGFVIIKEILWEEDMNDEMLDDFLKVSEISTNKTEKVIW